MSFVFEKSIGICIDYIYFLLKKINLTNKIFIPKYNSINIKKSENKFKSLKFQRQCVKSKFKTNDEIIIIKFF